MMSKYVFALLICFQGSIVAMESAGEGGKNGISPALVYIFGGEENAKSFLTPDPDAIKRKIDQMIVRSDEKERQARTGGQESCSLCSKRFDTKSGSMGMFSFGAPHPCSECGTIVCESCTSFGKCPPCRKKEVDASFAGSIFSPAMKTAVTDHLQELLKKHQN